MKVQPFCNVRYSFSKRMTVFERKRLTLKEKGV